VNWQGKSKYSEKTCPNVTLSTTNPTYPDMGLNPDRGGGKSATNRLSYGTANCLWVSNGTNSELGKVNGAYNVIYEEPNIFPFRLHFRVMK
jgi:hypothetical protein